MELNMTDTTAENLAWLKKIGQVKDTSTTPAEKAEDK
jgi:hypothetical protein